MPRVSILACPPWIPLLLGSCSWLQILRPPPQGESALNRAACGVQREDWLWGDGPRLWGHFLPLLTPPPSQPPPAFPAVSIPIWSQVNLWHNPTWKCMEMLPITMKPRERLSRWRPPWSAVCGFLPSRNHREPEASHLAQIGGVGPFV